MTRLRATTRAGHPPVRAGRLDPVARDALTAWAATRAGTALVALVGAIAGGAGASAWLARWDRWDVGLFRKIAEFGYDGYPVHYPDVGTAAFFPGLPLVLRAVHTVVPNWTAAGLLVSAVAGAVAAVHLARLAEDALPGAGRRAVLYLAVSPYAVFLAAGYSEALFLALALPAWRAALQRRWAAAGILAALATGVRVSGLFLAAALLVELAVAWRREGHRPGVAAVWLAAPAVTLGAYVVHLWTLTGDWLAWPHAQAAGWDRHFTAPWTAFATTWRAAAGGTAPEYVWAYRGEIAAVAIGVVLTVVLLARRRWAESVYVGASLAALATSTTYLSVPRAVLLWWPLWVLLAVAGRRRMVHVAYLVAALPLCALLVLAFTSGRWVA